MLLLTVRCMLLITLLYGSILAQNDTITVDGQKRTFITYVPSGISKPPLVISMHGLTGTGSQQRSMSRFDRIADSEKFIVVYPDGLNNRWDISGTTDVNFLLAIIDTMAARHSIDEDRVYSTGFSMGGMMSYKLACMASDRIAAIGPAAGYLFGGMRGCTPTRPMPILHIHGTADTIVDYSGLAGYIDGWVEKNGCAETPVITKPYPATKSTSKVTKEYYGEGAEGSVIIVLTVEGMSHAYPGSFGSQDINASEEFWAFFKTHPAESSGVQRHGSVRSLLQSVQASCQRGIVSIQSGTPLVSARLIDLTGKVAHSWRAGTTPVQTLSLPVQNITCGMYTLLVADRENRSLLRVFVP